ncbi:MAG: hypothetical protein IJ668_07735 [Selenomonadaceae bacterium]|nr:hypothetical protein [Selenomonadaceae bacterium]
MKQLRYTIRTLSPVVMSAMSNSTVMTTTHNEFSGSIMRGVMASRYVRNRQLGRAAHVDERFLRLFCGGLKFLPATPLCSGRRSFVLPLSLQKGKAGTADASRVQDLLTATDPAKGFKSLRGYGVVIEREVHQPSVEKNISMHMSRGSDEERLSGRSIDGLIFNYEAINEGQEFSGAVLGDDALLNELVDGLMLDGDEMDAHVGRSHFTQYGRCRLMFDGIADIDLPTLDEKIFLRLETPLLSTDEFFINAEEILSAEIISVLDRLVEGVTFKLGSIFGAASEVENFVVPWSMKRPRVPALAAGSVFELKPSQPLSDEQSLRLLDACLNGFGQRTEEGFGQLRLWRSSELTIGDEIKQSIAKPSSLSKDTIERAKRILINHCLEQIRVYAHEDAERLHDRLKHFGNLTHFFGRLEGIAHYEPSPEAVANRIELEMRGLFRDHIKALKMSGDASIYDVLTGKTAPPYRSRDLKSDLMSDGGKFDALMNELGIKDFDELMSERFFMEYMQNYFRAARKFAAAGGDEQ